MGFIPTVPQAFFMVFVIMIAWGSWANTMKKCGNWRFEGYYWDFAGSIILWTFLLGILLGGVTPSGWDSLQFIHSLQQTQLTAFLWAGFAGLVLGIGNILLIAAIALAGFATGFPLAIGIALVLGAVLAFVTNPGATSQPHLLFIGLAFITSAIIANSIAYHIKEQHKPMKTSSFKRGIILCLLSGVCIALFPFPFNYAFQTGMSPYVGSFLSTLGSFLAACILLPILMRFPLIPGQKSIGFTEYKRAKTSWHVWALIGGIVWSIGTIFNLVVSAQPAFSVAIAYTLGQCATMVAAIWGVFIWKEFKGAPPKVYFILGSMFALFIIGIILLAQATG